MRGNGAGARERKRMRGDEKFYTQQKKYLRDTRGIGKEEEQAGAFQSSEAQEKGAEKLPAQAIFLICTTAMYEMRKMGLGYKYKKNKKVKKDEMP